MPPNYLEAPSETRALRMHIQRQTLAYAKQYITTDYVGYTEEGTAQIFSTSLHPVSPHGPTDLALPIDPLDKLFSIYDQCAILPYDEELKLGTEEQVGMRRVFGTVLGAKKGEAPSTCAMMAEEPSTLDTPLRPLSPILTARARRKTPKILHRSRAQVIGMLPTELEELTEKGRIHPVEVEEIPLEKLDRDQYLNVEYAMTPEMAQDFRAFMARVPASRLGPQKASCPLGYSDFLRAESPPPAKCLPRPISPPLFPRSETIGGGGKRLEMGGIQTLESLGGLLDAIGAQSIRVENERFDMDEIAQQNMNLLCGDMSHILPSSSPPKAPSLGPPSQFSSSDAAHPSSPPPQTPVRTHPSEMAFLASSPPDARLQRIAKFDEVLFPKDQQRGRKLPPKKDGPTFAEFVSHLHHPVPSRPPIHAAPPIASIFVPASPSVSDSVAGQLGDEGDEEMDELADDLSAGILTRIGSRNPSRRSSAKLIRVGSKTANRRGSKNQNETGSKHLNRAESNNPVQVASQTSQLTVASDVDQLADDDTLIDSVVERLTGGLGVDPLEYAMQEKIEEKEMFLLDVPDLPPPNQHPKDGPPVPIKLSDLLAPSNQQETNSIGASQVGLKRVGGLQSLQLELEWRITMPGDRAPTHEQMAHADSLCDSETKALAKDAIKMLKASLSEGPAAGAAFQDEEDGAVIEKAPTNEEMIFTKRERARVFGGGFMPGSVHIENETPSTAVSYEQGDIEVQPEEYDPVPNDSGAVDAYMDLAPDPEPMIVPLTQASFMPLSFESERILSQWSQPRQDTWNAAAELEEYHQFGGTTPPEPDVYGHYAEPLQQEDFEEFLEDLQDQEGAYALELDGLEPVQEMVNRDEWPHNLPPHQTPTTDQVLDEAENISVMDLAQDEDEDIDQAVRALVYPDAVDQEVPLEWKNLQPKHSAQDKLASFMHTRGLQPQPACQSPTPAPDPTPTADPQPEPPRTGPYPIPSEINSMLTLAPYEPEDMDTQASPFCILASLQVMQHRALVQNLEHPSINLHLVERSDSTSDPILSWQDTSPPLHGASLSLDPSNALVLVPLADLPGPDAIPTLSRLLQGLLKRYDCIGLVLEAYSRRAKRNEGEGDFELDPFTPPAKKALASLRRTVALINGSIKTGGVRVGIARTPREEALLVRGAVDRAASEWKGACEVWGVREWIGEDESPEELELSSVPSMNIFASITVLAQTTIDELLGMSAEERSEVFAPSIGEARVAALNEAIAKGQERIEMMAESQN